MISGKASFKCSNKNCGSIISIEGSDFEIENTWSDPDRNMGSEEGYEGTVTAVCPNCGEEIEVTFEFTEYPVGVANYEEGPKFDKNVTVVSNTLTIF